MADVLAGHWEKSSVQLMVHSAVDVTVGLMVNLTDSMKVEQSAEYLAALTVCRLADVKVEQTVE
jgi:hypothetical protein